VARPFEAIEESLRERLADIRCPEHDLPAELKVVAGTDGALQIIPVGCCDEVDRLVYAALRRSETIVPPPIPELELAFPRIPR
jgi:hypothetical protein